MSMVSPEPLWCPRNPPGELDMLSPESNRGDLDILSPEPTRRNGHFTFDTGWSG